MQMIFLALFFAKLRIDAANKSAGNKGDVRPTVITNIAELRFAPMPKHGPFKVLRRKIHTALRIWVLEGWSSVKEAMRERRHS